MPAVKIGMVNYGWKEAHASLVHVACTTAAALARHHDLQPYPAEYQFAPPARQRELLKTWMADCDAIVGSVENSLFRARAELDRQTPYACLLLGTLSRGGGWLRDAHRHLRTCDILIGNCEADVALAKRFFVNATVRRVPLAYEDAVYYPADDAAKSNVRATLGIGADEPLIVYAGRITLEKNLHTLLKAFRVVLNAVPATRLVIAGDERGLTFAELGSRPLALRRTLDRLAARWQLGDRVLFVGHRDADTLRALYSTADVLVNLSLNHDENFGLVQIEAMACGLPAVGTTWGGLKDTIREGVTGTLVPTVFTTTGVKVDWWQAASRIVSLLARRSDREPAVRERCAEHVRSRYSMAEYARALDAVVRECVALAAGPVEPLRPTEFAQRYWATCVGRNGGSDDGTKPPYRRGPEAWALYRELIEPFAGTADDESAWPRAGWCLPAPLVMQRDDAIAVNDPLYPLEISVPSHLAPSVERLIGLFTRHAVIDDAALAEERVVLGGALSWMQAAGLLLRTSTAALDPSYAHGALGEPVFAIQHIDHAADIVSTA